MNRRLTLGAIALTALLPLSAIADEPLDAEASAKLHEIADHVAAEIYSLPNYGAFDWISILASPDGTITLSGSIATKNLEPDAEKVAKKVDGAISAMATQALSRKG